MLAFKAALGIVGLISNKVSLGSSWMVALGKATGFGTEEYYDTFGKQT